MSHFKGENGLYNILGSFEDARNIVQDQELKLAEDPPVQLKNEKSNLIKSVIYPLKSIVHSPYKPYLRHESYQLYPLST
ncbi:hypothetical protein [Membranihabitans maritimus]|uniref:hypothetical protein n=1 Tax=Membranihabitans maritimus TaxID=2904244 RepID=UPI001F47E678|nr:hypothetical protein [Membranihabitans maritimus]